MKLTDERKGALVTAACLLIIAIIFRNVIHKPMDLLVSIGPFYIFFLYLITKGQTKKSAGSQIKIWNIVTILVTFLIIIIFAVR